MYKGMSRRKIGTGMNEQADLLGIYTIEEFAFIFCTRPSRQAHYVCIRPPLLLSQSVYPRTPFDYTVVLTSKKRLR